MFSGEFKHTIDPKNRLFIPAKFREELTRECENFMIVKSVREKCLNVYSMRGWEEYIAQVTKLERKDNEKALRALHRQAAQVTADSQGRVVLPPSLLQHANIDKGAVVVGCGVYVEIWSEAEYEAMTEAEDMDSLRELLESYGL